MLMSTVPSMPFRLESLRRSTWLAGFLLLVCLMRVGMVMACAPHDIAESLAGGAHEVVVAQVGDDSTSNESSPNTGAGHCLHCACHFSAALPAAILAMSALTGQDMQVHFQTHRGSVAPDRELRPPIV
ncbi:MAG: hypothetical protein V9E93_03875 [Steroidobacteraceae bacterium]|nr:hypothetical protein [Pseudomonadota bacterium]MBP6107780.1 hypothetical protein [Steroidobacteraceae bacterium]MBP7015061.1 hypothetical protein [Steroidobacteraceae bacterium]